MRLRIRPLDTLFFQDGKPFSMGEDTWADGIFPPYPSTLYGAIRTWYISNLPGGFSGDNITKSGDIKLRGIHYRLEDGVYLPMPSDLMGIKEKSHQERNREEREKSYKVIKLAAQEVANPSLSNYPLSHLLLPPSMSGTDSGPLTLEELDDGLISGNSFKNYLSATDSDLQVRKTTDFALSEPKVGIGRNRRTNTAQEGKLYRVGMRRSTGFEIILEFDLPDESGISSRFLKLGAEGKVSSVERLKGRVDALKISEDTISLNDPHRFKLYLATPLIVAMTKNKSEDYEWAPDLGGLGIQATLCAAAVSRPLHIGGFDMQVRRPKPMLKAIPAGSVFYYHTKEDPAKVLGKLQGKSIMGELPEEARDTKIEQDHCKQGFGISYVGNW